jgi:hypothetical protein
MSGPTANPISTITGQSSASNYGFVDPYGVTGQLQSSLYGPGGAVSGGPLGTFNQGANSVMGQIAGLSGPLQQTLSGMAQYQANNALNATASNFANQGALGSGAAAQAFGQAIAQPFAQAQSQLQQSQLGAAGGALQSLLGVSGSAYGQGLQQGGNVMEHASGLVAPTYYTNPQYTQQAQGKQGAQGAGKGAASGLGGLIPNIPAGAGTLGTLGKAAA